jgi:hypothetical protein
MLSDRQCTVVISERDVSPLPPPPTAFSGHGGVTVGSAREAALPVSPPVEQTGQRIFYATTCTHQLFGHSEISVILHVIQKHWRTPRWALWLSTLVPSQWLLRQRLSPRAGAPATGARDLEASEAACRRTPSGCTPTGHSNGHIAIPSSPRDEFLEAPRTLLCVSLLLFSLLSSCYLSKDATLNTFLGLSRW